MDDTPISDDRPDNADEIKNLRFLRLLVTVLTGTMIIGLLAIVAMLVIRFTGQAPPMALPDVITLPEGASVIAFTRGPDWYAVVTDGNEILIFDAASGALRQTIALDLPE